MADRFFDTILAGPLQRQIKSMDLDPASLPDFQIQLFEYGKGWFAISGNISFTKGVLIGMSKVERSMECESPQLSFTESSIECAFNFPDMVGTYDAAISASAMPLISFKVFAYVNGTQVRSVLSANPTRMRAQLKRLEVTEFGDFDVRLKEMGRFAYIFKAVANNFRSIIKEHMISRITKGFAPALQKAVSMVKLGS